MNKCDDEIGKKQWRDKLWKETKCKTYFIERHIFRKWNELRNNDKITGKFKYNQAQKIMEIKTNQNQAQN